MENLFAPPSVGVPSGAADQTPVAANSFRFVDQPDIVAAIQAKLPNVAITTMTGPTGIVEHAGRQIPVVARSVAVTPGITDMDFSRIVNAVADMLRGELHAQESASGVALFMFQLSHFVTELTPENNYKPDPNARQAVSASILRFATFHA